MVECGLIVHPSKGFLAAFPDGIVQDANNDETGLLKIKCPYTKRDSSIKEACVDGNFFCTLNNSELQTLVFLFSGRLLLPIIWIHARAKATCSLTEGSGKCGLFHGQNDYCNQEQHNK